MLSLDAILFPVFMIKVGVKHMMFELKVKGKDDFTDVFVEFGEKRADVTSDDIGILESLVLQLSRSRYDALDAPRLEKFKMSTDNDLRLLPLSKEAQRQHIYRVSYQGRYL